MSAPSGREQVRGRPRARAWPSDPAARLERGSRCQKAAPCSAPGPSPSVPAASASVSAAVRQIDPVRSGRAGRPQLAGQHQRAGQRPARPEPRSRARRTGTGRRRSPPLPSGPARPVQIGDRRRGRSRARSAPGRRRRPGGAPDAGREQRRAGSPSSERWARLPAAGFVCGSFGARGHRPKNGFDGQRARLLPAGSSVRNLDASRIAANVRPPLPSVRTMADYERPPRVLVVEDDDAIAQVLQRSLRMEGYDVKIAGDGDQRARSRRTPSCPTW